LGEGAFSPFPPKLKKRESSFGKTVEREKQSAGEEGEKGVCGLKKKAVSHWGKRPGLPLGAERDAKGGEQQEPRYGKYGKEKGKKRSHRKGETCSWGGGRGYPTKRGGKKASGAPSGKGSNLKIRGEGD